MNRKSLLLVAMFMAALAAVTAGGSVRAQNATPSPMAMDMTAAHPVHIHTGSCPKPGAIAWVLNDLSAPGMPMTMMGTPVMGTPMAMPTMAASPMAMSTPMAGMGMVVAQSVTTVKVNLADLEKAPFAINAHESLAQIGTYIACGDVTGTISGGSLTIQLQQLNNSGVAGVAMLRDNGDGTTTVAIELMQVMR